MNIGVYVFSLYDSFLRVYAQQQGRKRDADVEKGDVDTAEEEEGETDWERRTDIYTPPCVKRGTSGKLLYSTWNSVLGDDLEGRGRGVGGRLKWEGVYVSTQRIHFVVQ